MVLFGLTTMCTKFKVSKVYRTRDKEPAPKLQKSKTPKLQNSTFTIVPVKYHENLNIFKTTGPIFIKFGTVMHYNITIDMAHSSPTKSMPISKIWPKMSKTLVIDRSHSVRLYKFFVGESKKVQNSKSASENHENVEYLENQWTDLDKIWYR